MSQNKLNDIKWKNKTIIFMFYDIIYKNSSKYLAVLFKFQCCWIILNKYKGKVSR